MLFADLKGSMELLADRDPEEARQLLDPVLERMMAAVHRYEGTVNQVMGDGIMALFGAPVAHEDHAVRACYAALAHAGGHRAGTPTRCGGTHGVDVQIRVGLNAGEVVVRAIGNDLHMDYSAIGQTTHLAARMEQLALPGTDPADADRLRPGRGLRRGHPPGSGAGEGAAEPVGGLRAAARRRRCGSRLQAAVARGLTRFVGRDAELEQLRQALARAGAGPGAGGGPAWGRRAWASPACSTSSPGRTIPMAGCCWRATRCPMARPPPTCRSLTCSRATSVSNPGTTSAAVREKITGKLLTLDRALEPTLRPCWPCWRCQ